jgi:hypothetical protein
MSALQAIADRVEFEALRGEAASARACICELIRFRDGRSELNYAIYHDRCRRSVDGWRFTGRVYEVRYLGHSPLAGSAPPTAGNAGNPLTGNKSSAER